MHPLPALKAKTLYWRSLATLAFLPLLFASCEESEILFILNPDGSGRVTTEERILTSNLGIEGKQALQQAALGALAEIVQNSKGIDVWEKVAYQLTESGDVVVEATGLFPDLAKIELASTAESGTLATGLKFDRGDKGKKPAVIELRSPIAATPQQTPPKDPPAPGSVSAELKKTRETWGQAEKNIRLEFDKKQAKVTFHLPGKISSQSNFVEDAKNQVSLTVTAKNMLDTLSEVIADDQIAKEILKSGAKIMDNHGAPPIRPDTFNQLSFGEAKPIRVEFQSGEPVFNYHGAVSAAKAKPSELLKQVSGRGQE